MASAADVPGKYDLVIEVDGTSTGFLFDDSAGENGKAVYGYSPTFVERQNVQGGYGDDFQAFWLTSSQNNWSGGEDQKFLRVNDEDSHTMYWKGSNVNLTTPGQVTIGSDASALAFTLAAYGSTYVSSSFFVASSTNLYEVSNIGVVTDRGSHGAGGVGTAVITDGVYVYISGQACTSVRRYNTVTHAFSTFSSTPSVNLAFLNNTLWGFTVVGNLVRYDTAGSPTTIFTWKDAIGGSQANNIQLAPFGGKLLLLKPSQNVDNSSELWIYEGVAPNRLASLPPNFSAHAMCVAGGIVWIIGLAGQRGPGNRTEVYYYVNGNIGRAFFSDRYSTGLMGTQAISAFTGGLVFTDAVNGNILYYDLGEGSIASITPWTPAVSTARITGGNSVFLLTQESTTGKFWTSGDIATTGEVQSSLQDFDSSLDKYIRSVKVDFDEADDGDGGTIDLSYRLNSLSSNSDLYTTVQADAQPGVEYTIGQKARSISIKATLNKGTSTDGPTLKRTYVRAAPILQRYRNVTYQLVLAGTTYVPLGLRDGTKSPKTGREMADALITAIASDDPVTITDRFGTFTGLLEPADSKLSELHAAPLNDGHGSGSFVARVVAREV